MSITNLNSVSDALLTPSSNENLNDSAPINVEKTEISQPEMPLKRDIDSTKFAQIAKKEAQLVKEREAFKKEMEAFRNEQTEIDKYKKAWSMVNEIAELQKVDPLAAMRKAGFSDAEIINLVTSETAPQSTEERAMKFAQMEIEKFREEQRGLQENANKQMEMQKKQEEERQIAKFRNDIDLHIKADPDKYEYCNFMGPDAVNLINEIVAAGVQENEMISLSEATQLAEEYYEEYDKSMSTLKKRQPPKKEPAKPAEGAVVPEEPTQSITPTTHARTHERVPAQQYQSNKTPVKTITNKFTPPVHNAPTNNNRELTASENKQQVLQKWLKQLKP